MATIDKLYQQKFALNNGDEIPALGFGTSLSDNRKTRDAVKAAVMCEDVARTVHLARAYGELTPLTQDQVDALHRRYTQEYGQRPEGM